MIIPKCIFGNQVKKFCLLHNIEIIEAPANDNRAIGFDVCLIQTIRRRLVFTQVGNSATNSFCLKAALKSVFKICYTFATYMQSKQNKDFVLKSAS